MKKFLRIGIHDHQPDYIQFRIRIANLLYLTVVALAVGYSAMIAVKMPELYYVPFLGLASMGIAQLLNYFGFHQFYRLILCVMPGATIFMYHVGVIPEGGSFLPSSAVMTLAFSIMPFVLYDVREKGYITASLVASLFFLLSPQALSGIIETSIDEDKIRYGRIQEISFCISFFILTLAVYSLNRFNHLANEKARSLRAEGEQRTKEIETQRQQMEEHLQKLEIARKEEEKRNWAAQGFSEFGAILRQNDNIETLYDSLIAKLVTYIGANQGAIYVAEEEDKQVRLELKSCFAYNRKKFVDQTISPGQGLVGQCYLEKDLTYMTQVPDGYTYITSGLGESTPRSLILVPLVNNEKVEGVVEIASFKEMEPYVLEFIKKLGQEIAASLNIVKINSLTRKLLEDAQQQAEEMRAQEEEMRQNMEELAATQEEMERKEQEYIRQIESLKAEKQTA